MKIIAIHDENNGHKSQLYGVLQGFLNENIKIIKAKKSWLNLLPYFLLEKFLFTLKINNLQEYKQANLIISIGKKSLPYAIYLKKLNPNAKLVFLMPSGNLSKKYADLIFYHSYKQKNYSNNKYFPIVSAPHSLNKEKLQNAALEWQKSLSSFKKPITTVIVGGDAKKIKLTKQAINNLVKEVIKIKEKVGGSIFVTTSRRTKIENEIYLQQQLQSLITKKECFFWGYNQNKNINKNPYLAMLAMANYVLITGESISMISESCSLDKNVGVYVYFSKNFYAKRYIKFHENLYLNNYAKPLSKFTKETKRATLNITNNVIDKIKEIL